MAMIDRQNIKLINNYIARIADGDSQALELLFDKTKKYFFVVARSFLDDKSKAEDVLSLAYYKVVVNAKSFKRDTNGYNWMFEIVKNTALNQNKTDRVKSSEPLDESFARPYEVVDELIDNLALGEAREKLTEEEKKILYAYYYEGKTINEISKALKKPKSTVHYVLKGILAKLKKYLSD